MKYMIIKRTIFTVIFGLLAMSAMAQDGFTLKGKFTENHDGQKVMLTYIAGNKAIQDSVLVKNGLFLFKGKVKEVVKATITLKAFKESEDEMVRMFSVDEQYFFLDNKNMSFYGATANSAVIKGGEAQADYLLLKKELHPFQSKEDSLNKLIFKHFMAKNDVERIKAIKQLDVPEVEISRIKNAFMIQHPDSYVALNMVESKGGIIDVKKFEPLFTALSPRMRNSPRGKKLAARLQIAKRTSVGQSAIDFKVTDAKGNPVSLAALKGKYVLLDFWASWCGPCRAENPNVLKVYQRFKDRKFDIIAVSLDEKKEAWLTAVEEDGLPWPQVRDLKGTDKSLVSIYDIKSVPQNFLIGPDGVILAKNLRGKNLEKKLADLIKD